MEKNLGHATAYGYAKSKGYTGTEEEFGVLMASYASVAQDASQSASRAAESAQLASNEAQRASQSATNAHNDAETVSNIKTDVESARDTTVSAKNATVEAKDISVEAKNSAINAKNTAESKAQIAEAWAVGQKDGTDVPSTDETYHNNAKYYSEQANTAKTDAESAQQLAQTSATNASESASEAAASAQTVSQAAQTATDKASEASQSASVATNKASEASQSATSASQSASTATNKASEATTAAATATSKASEAAASATTASTAKTNAETARDTAAQSASEAAASAIEAAQSAQSVDAERLNRIAFGSYVVKESTGSIARFEDGADSIPMKDVLVHVDPVQDLHGYDSPWPAGGGKNLCALNNFTITKKDVTFAYANGKLIVNGTPSTTGWFYIGERFRLPAGTYTVSYTVSGSNPVIRIGFDNFGGYIQFNIAGTQQKTFTLSEETVGILDLFCNQTTAYANTEILIQIEAGSSATSWTPYSNICPITGWTGCEVQRTGKNLLDLSNLRKGNFDGGLNNNNVSFDEYQPIKGGQTYVWSSLLSNISGRYLRFYDINKTELSEISLYGTGAKTFSAPSNARYFRCMWYVSTGVEPTDIVADQIELGSTATDYESYQGSTYDITFPSEAGTVYGGTLDVTSGVLTVLSVYLNMANIQEWNLDTNNGRVYTIRPDLASQPNTDTPSQGLLCNRFKTVSFTTVYSGTENGVAISTRNALQFRIKGLTDNPESTTQDVYDYFAEHETHIVANLATPVTYTLTPQEITSLLGTNNLWADTGDSEITYCVDPTLLLDNESSEIQSIKSMIAGVESSAVATKNYSIGDLVIVEDTLYEVTAAIASGETISASKTRVTTVDDVIENRIVDSIDATLTVTGNAADAKAVGDAIASEDKKALAAFATDTASGAVANFPDGADSIPMKDVLVHVNPVQDLHGYDNPWPAGGGVNQWDEDWESGYYNRATGAKEGDGNTTYFRSKNFIPCAPNTSYYFKAPSVHASNATYYAVLFYNADKNYISAINSGVGNTAQTTPQNAQFMTFYIEVGTSDATYHNDIAINYPATVTTYSPYFNICPISGWTGVTVTRAGKNLYNKTQYPFARYNVYNPSVCWTPPIFVKHGTYTFSCSSGFGTCYISVYKTFEDATANANRFAQYYFSNGSSITKTFDEDVYVRYQQNETGGTDEDYAKVSQSWRLELGSTATDYEPYHADTYDITFPTEAGTVYGGTLDVTSGVLTVDRAMVDLGTLNYRYNAVNTLAFDTNGALTPHAKNNNCICSHYMTLPNPTASNLINNDKYVAINIKDDGTAYTGYYVAGVFIIKDTEYSDVASFKSAMSGVQLCYELATPITYTLTPQEITSLLGTNNMWADTGDTEVEYRADAKLYITKKITEAVSALS